MLTTVSRIERQSIATLFADMAGDFQCKACGAELVLHALQQDTLTWRNVEEKYAHL